LNLGEGRFVALPDGLGAGDQRYGAVRLEPDVDILARWAAGRLDVIGKAEARAVVRVPRSLVAARENRAQVGSRFDAETHPLVLIARITNGIEVGIGDS
jgi:hypothetical protein